MGGVTDWLTTQHDRVVSERPVLMKLMENQVGQLLSRLPLARTPGHGLAALLFLM